MLVSNKAHHIDPQAVLDVLCSQSVTIHTNQADQIRHCAHDLFLVAINQRGVEVLVLERQDHVASLVEDRLAHLAFISANGTKPDTSLGITAVRDEATDIDDLSGEEEFAARVGTELEEDKRQYKSQRVGQRVLTIASTMLVFSCRAW